MSSKEHEDRLGQSETGWAEMQGSERPGPQSTRASGAPWGDGRPRAEAGYVAGPPGAGRRSTPADGASVRADAGSRAGSSQGLGRSWASWASSRTGDGHRALRSAGCTGWAGKTTGEVPPWG